MYRYSYSCGGFSSWHGPCGANDCGSCRNGAPPWEEEEEEEEEQLVVSTDYRVVRKVRTGECWRRSGRRWPEYKVGDLVKVVWGFAYAPGGARTGYFHSEERVGFGPGHEDAGSGKWERSKKGSYEAYSFM